MDAPNVALPDQRGKGPGDQKGGSVTGRLCRAAAPAGHPSKFITFSTLNEMSPSASVTIEPHPRDRTAAAVQNMPVTPAPTPPALAKAWPMQVGAGGNHTNTIPPLITSQVPQTARSKRMRQINSLLFNAWFSSLSLRHRQTRLQSQLPSCPITSVHASDAPNMLPSGRAVDSQPNTQPPRLLSGPISPHSLHRAFHTVQ